MTTTLVANPGRLISVWAGRKFLWVDNRIRRWTVPRNDHVAWPTHEFYSGRFVQLTNNGTASYPFWIALDRVFDEGWNQFYLLQHQCAPWSDLTDKEFAFARKER